MAFTTTASAGSPNATIVDPRLIIEIRDAMLVEGLLLQVDQTGEGLGHLFPRLSNSFSPGQPLIDIANGATEADSVTDTQLTTDSVTLTPAVKAAYVVMSKINERSGSVSWNEEIRALLARAAADKVDSDAWSNFTSFSNVTGATGQKASLGWYRSGLTALRITAKAFASRCVTILHPTQMGHIQDELLSGAGTALSQVLSKPDIASVFGDAGASSGITESFVGMLLSKPVFQTTNVPVAGPDYAGGMFVPANPSDADDIMVALSIVWKWAAEIEKFNLSVIAQPAFRYAVEQAYQTGILNNALARKMLSAQ